MQEIGKKIQNMVKKLKKSNDIKTQIENLEKLDEIDFLKEIQERRYVSDFIVAYFASKEPGNGNVIKRWYAKAELELRHSKQIQLKISIALWTIIIDKIIPYIPITYNYLQSMISYIK